MPTAGPLPMISGDGSIVSELYTGNYSITGGASVSSSDALVTLTGNNPDPV